jgi:hypothetical protein
VPAAVDQALIGHDSEAMHELYVSVGHEALKKAAAALPEILVSDKINCASIAERYGSGLAKSRSG